MEYSRAFYSKQDQLNSLSKGLFILALLLALMALQQAFMNTSPDYQQGDMFKLIYLHVPCAWFSLLTILSASASQLILSFKPLLWQVRVLRYASIQIGIICTLLALLSGYYWGQAIWGGVIWSDPRFLFQLAILFLFVLLILQTQADVKPFCDKVVSSGVFILCLAVSLINHFSVYIMKTIHQLPSVIRGDNQITIDVGMRLPLWLASASLLILFAFLIVRRLTYHNQQVYAALKH